SQSNGSVLWIISKEIASRVSFDQLFLSMLAFCLLIPFAIDVSRDSARTDPDPTSTSYLAKSGCLPSSNSLTICPAALLSIILYFISLFVQQSSQRSIYTERCGDNRCQVWTCSAGLEPLAEIVWIAFCRRCYVPQEIVNYATFHRARFLHQI